MCEGLRGEGAENVILSKVATIHSRPFSFVGEWLSLVEHLVRDQGVGGSNPLSPTNTLIRCKQSSGFRLTGASLGDAAGDQPTTLPSFVGSPHIAIGPSAPSPKYP